MLCDRPTPDSSIPPHHTGMPRSCAALCTAMASEKPPTRPSLMLMIRHDSISMAASASRRLRMDSSRQMGVCKPLLQHGVVIEVVVPEGLLDHQQVEGVKRGQVVGIPQAVGRVGVATERDAGPLVPHPLEDLHIPARLAFELDALVAGGQFPLDDRHQLGNRRLNSQRHAAGNRRRAPRRSGGRAKRPRAAPPDPRWRFPAWPWPCGCRAPGGRCAGNRRHAPALAQPASAPVP